MYRKNIHIHFVGIGGIGMSGIAEIVRQRGYRVSGCDAAASSRILEHLKDLGCTICQGHDPSHLSEVDVVVYSSMIKQDNPEMVAATAKGIPVIQRALMLAELMRTKYSVAVSGAHGKTTTTSMISHILIEAQLDPTVVVGGILKNLSTNAQFGKGAIFVAEADESDRSFLSLNPTTAIVTNIDNDHLDTYKDLDDIKQTFKNFLARLPFYGKAIICIDDPHIQSILPLPHVRSIKYGFSPEAEIMGKVVLLDSGSSIFDVYIKGMAASHVCLGRVVLQMPGEHNILNALAAIALALEYEISFEKIQSALATFGGVERRFEYKGTVLGLEIFDDYGHHPTEVLKTLEVARKRAQKRLIVAFQLHRFSRTQKLWQEFIDLFSTLPVDALLLPDIYPAMEEPIEGITTERLVAELKKQVPELPVYYCPQYLDVQTKIEELMQPGDLLLTIGAGPINRVGEALLKSQ
jgi:UDP-N-acetylmuramate--alanine ligase